MPQQNLRRLPRPARTYT